MAAAKQKLNSSETKKLLGILRARFEANMNRHKSIDWAKVETKLIDSPEKLWSLNEMEKTGGEPDVTGYDKKTDEYIFTDCSPESPKERRSICYDSAALASRKEHKPWHSALGMAEEMGVTILSVAEYAELQKLGSFDLKTSSWLLTPEKIRSLGGALFGDRRYDTVFTYHNGAESYYAARGFRASLRV